MEYYKYSRSHRRSSHPDQSVHLMYIIVLFIIIIYYYYSSALVTKNISSGKSGKFSTSTEKPTAYNLITKFNIPTTSTPTPKNYTEKDEELIVRLFNKIGSIHEFTEFDAFAANIQRSGIDEKSVKPIVKNLHSIYKIIDKKVRVRQDVKAGQNIERKVNKKRNSPRINIGAISCGKRTKQMSFMLKSAALFSQDAALHIILFTDKEAVRKNSQNLLELKWTANSLGWDLTFEIHLTWFPGGENSVWKKMYLTCATQRLFFPSVLPHIDSLIYLDSDTIVISNLTEFWMEFSLKMGKGQIAALSNNNEEGMDGWYNWLDEKARIPFYGKRGLNAGVMLMNLTEMRRFGFQEKSVAINTVYKEKIQLADQDIINILFSGFPEKVAVIDCSYNFNWIHCGDPDYQCVFNGTNKCFCNGLTQYGARILHGNGGTFYEDYVSSYSFLVQVRVAIQKLDLLNDSYVAMFQNLRKQFNNSVERPCLPLTVDQLYGNADSYLRDLKIK